MKYNETLPETLWKGLQCRSQSPGYQLVVDFTSSFQLHTNHKWYEKLMSTWRNAEAQYLSKAKYVSKYGKEIFPYNAGKVTCRSSIPTMLEADFTDLLIITFTEC